MEFPIEAHGILMFDPEDVSKKHSSQSVWKKTAMVMLHDDTAEYYAWFVRKRYNVILNKPLRGSHVTFINDRESETNGKWNSVKERWHGKSISLNLNPDVRTNAEFWWLRVSYNETLMGIRAELGLGEPFFSLHLTIGYPNDKNEHHSRYIHHMLSNGMIR
jgi:hypothetical protein